QPRGRCLQSAATRRFAATSENKWRALSMAQSRWTRPAPSCLHLLSGLLIVALMSTSVEADPPKKCIDCGGAPAPSLTPWGGNDGLESPGASCRSFNADNLTRRPTTRNTGDAYL